MAMSAGRGFAAGNGCEFALAACSCLAERQSFTIARSVCGRRAALAGRGSIGQNLKFIGQNAIDDRYRDELKALDLLEKPSARESPIILYGRK